MQSATASSKSYRSSQANNNNPNLKSDPLLKIFIACILNSAVTIYQISKKNIKHLKCSQLITLSFTVTSPLIPTLTLILSVALIGTITLKLLNKKSPLWEKTSDHLSNFSIINTVALSSATFFIHELGHATLATCFFKTPRVTIKIFPFLGGETTYAISYGFTKIGSFFGRERALLMITSGGFLASTATSLLATQISKLLRESNPLSSKILKYFAVSQILNELIHAISSLIESEADYQNDFTYLRHAGCIHPLIPISLMAATCLYSIYSVQIL